VRSIVLAILAFTAHTAHAGQLPIDLAGPGVLDRIQKENPARYGKILDIMRVAGEVSCETLPQVLKVSHDVSRANCQGSMILTSYPAKRHLAFTLDDTRYVVNVVLNGHPGKLQPLGLTLTRP
jgi:hypothetical protein